MARIAQTPGKLKDLIDAAEGVWFEVFYSGDGNKAITVGGNEYHLLPLRFSTRVKVISYFRHYWGIAMSNRMFCNLHTIRRNNRLYVIVGDPGIFTTIPRRVRVTSRTATRIRVTAVLSMSEDYDEETMLVQYLIGKSGTGLRVLDRNKKDERFARCGMSG
ncbi:DL-endopeptidase inhibitor IseA family protein [Paenibacillus pedocola]|uniref:DL-endopeptidase inhibitor IseA family protein n=1 Tax=Paenibacillus pedocola TaxID=3242193 RepID=UPI00287757A8|nr:DL-endopeptidase inhibitor IseA family protein [Paenibacillus typhae]